MILEFNKNHPEFTGLRTLAFCCKIDKLERREHLTHIKEINGYMYKTNGYVLLRYKTELTGSYKIVSAKKTQIIIEKVKDDIEYIDVEKFINRTDQKLAGKVCIETTCIGIGRAVSQMLYLTSQEKIVFNVQFVIDFFKTFPMNILSGSINLYCRGEKESIYFQYESIDLWVMSFIL